MITIAPERYAQAAFDHAKTALDMLNQRMADDSLDGDGLAARSHLIEAMAALNAVLAKDAGQQGLEL